jgi:hypothetical protein
MLNVLVRKHTQGGYRRQNAKQFHVSNSSGGYIDAKQQWWIQTPNSSGGYRRQTAVVDTDAKQQWWIQTPNSSGGYRRQTPVSALYCDMQGAEMDVDGQMLSIQM